jgi:hypothetical protein
MGNLFQQNLEPVIPPAREPNPGSLLFSINYKRDKSKLDRPIPAPNSTSKCYAISKEPRHDWLEKNIDIVSWCA